MTTISKRERKYIHWAVVHQKSILTDVNGVSTWDGDKAMPVKVGTICEALVERGLFQRIRMPQNTAKIIATPKALTLRCQADHCQQGKRYNDLDQLVDECDVCEGTGIVLHVK